MSSTSSPPGTQAGHSPNEPPDRGGTPGTFVADGQGGETEASSNAGDAWQQVPFTPVRLGARRPREMAETPVLAPASKQVRFADAEDDATEPDDGGISSASVEQDGVGARPTRTAALQASKALTREAQAIAVGLTPSRSGQGSLGSALGIGRANADNIVTAESGGIDEAAASSSSSSAPAAAAEAGNLTEGAAAGGAGEELRGLIAALEFRQRQRAEDTTQLCRSVDAAVSSGAVSKSGGELLMLALRLALAQGEQGPHAPEVAPALIECLRKYDVSKPQHFQRPDLTRTVRREPASATPAAASKAPPAPRRWEHLSKMRTLGGGNGSAQAMAEKGGYKPSTMAFSLATDSSASTLLPHQRMQLVNEALSKAGAPETVRMAASELTGGGETLKIKPGPKCSFDELHAHREVIREALGAVEVRDAKQWTRCKVLYVPKRQGELDLSADIVRKDIEASIGVKLVRDPHRLHRGEADARREWDHMQFAVLEEDMKRRPRTVSIAGVEYVVTEWIDKRRKAPCDHCLGYHRPSVGGCTNKARCKHCGSDAHETEAHKCKHCESHGARSCPVRCPNCEGPHAYDDQGCRLMPRMNKHTRCWLVPATAQARAVRNQGRLDFQKAVAAVEEQRKKEGDSSMQGVDTAGPAGRAAATGGGASSGGSSASN
ncbi:hypothetical protein OC842_004670 [Tilletia horrida]|uniref:Uncharacterized protein n=1 Tax=Tilletia horrida TaxID=155126 RepID=A0AAN6JJ37_9BASI|nr:hypothetical protein OC842_004670 [Tilletia horrida]